jgi:hypothetical protein
LILLWTFPGRVLTRAAAGLGLLWAWLWLRRLLVGPLASRQLLQIGHGRARGGIALGPIELVLHLTQRLARLA